MRSILNTLLEVRHADEEVVMRGRNLIKIATGLAIGLLVITVIWASRKIDFAAIGSLTSCIACIVAIWLVRQGRIIAAGTTLLGTMIVLISSSIVIRGRLSDTAFFMIAPIIVASAIFKPRQVFITALIALGTLFPPILYVWQRSVLPTTRMEQLITIDAILMLVTCSVVSYLISSSTSSFLKRLQQSQQQLASLAASLEVQVEQRTSELTQALEYQQSQALELQSSLKQQRALNDMINALSFPLIPVRRDVLVLPLIGNLDAERIQQLLSNTLFQVQHMRVRALILDVTGIALIDMQLAQALVRLGQAVQLLGAQIVIVGVRPEIAQTLVSLGTNLSHLRSAASLQEGIELCR